MRIRTIGMTTTVALCAMFLASGCVLRARGRARLITPPPPSAHATVRVNATAPPPPQARATVVVQAPQAQVTSGVQIIEATCTQGAAEVCNGLDDNCDGRIDENCGYSSGNVQITLSWDTGADLDLYVTDPNQETLNYRNTNVSSGGRLDQDARGQCRSAQANNTIENVFWDAGTPPPGNYGVAVHYYGECNSNAGPTNATVSVSVGGQIMGVYRVVLAPAQRMDIVNFTVGG